MTAAARSEVTALFWDIGGVILSNGWGNAARTRAVQHFEIDREDLERRHASAFPAFEMGQITLAEYLDLVVFWRPQTFAKEEFTAFMFAQSSENAEARAVLDELTAARRYLLAAINNEGSELNAYRITTFHLTRNFTAFFSSCYVGLRKPDERIYRLALEVTQRKPEECLFIDDRPDNLEGARRLGMRTIHFQTASQLRGDLANQGVSGAPA